jgi:putative phage-type endonuclease
VNQGTPEWLLARAGHVTASRFKDVLATVRVGEAAGRRDYRWQLVTERLTGLPQESYTNTAMQWGTDHERAARDAYDAHTGELVALEGFVLHSDIPWVGCSPDGFVGTDGAVEIKCPYGSVVHVQTISGGMPSEHRAQVQGVLWVTGRDWCDFISYDPRMPEKLQLHVERVKRDDAYIEKLEAEVRKFLVEVEQMHMQLLVMAA